MGLLRRMKGALRSARDDPWAAMSSPIDEDGKKVLSLLDTEQRRGSFDLREWAAAMLVADFLSATHALNALGVSAEDWWVESMLDEQYHGGSRNAREGLLRTAMRFNNALDQAEYDDPRALLMHAATRFKALGLALDCDVKYGTRFTWEIANRPQSFGVHEPDRAS